MSDKYTPPRQGMVDGIIEEAKFSDPIYLTHPNIPKPLHGQNPRTILGQTWWDKKRQETYAKNNYCCWACGISKYNAKYHHWLEAHESYLIDYRQGEARLKEIVALCHSCHNFIHSGRMYMMYLKGELSKDKCLDILQHGFSILENAGLEPFMGTVMVWNEISEEQRSGGSDPDKNGWFADWNKWHLVIEGNRYYSKFRDIEDWADYYGN